MMKAVSLSNGDRIAILQALLNHVKEKNPQFRSFIRRAIINTHERQKDDQASKETIRRLKIQNKKLLELVILLKSHLKKLTDDNKKIKSQLERTTKKMSEGSDKTKRLKRN